jgi:hypothetical protein
MRQGIHSLAYSLRILYQTNNDYTKTSGSIDLEKYLSNPILKVSQRLQSRPNI